jgi:tetratricopeptide (TPR) repeat protein
VNTYRKQVGKQAETVTDVVNTNRFTRQGEPFEMNATSRFVENAADGRALDFTHRYDLGVQQLLQAQGHVQGDTLDLRMLEGERASAGQTSVTGASFRFPAGEGLEKVYSAHYHDQPGSHFRFQTLNLGARPELVDTDVTPLNGETLALADSQPSLLGGRPASVRKFALKNPNNPASTVYEWRDAHGKLYKASASGQNGVEMVRVSQRAVREAAPLNLDLMTASEIMTNAIPQPRVTDEALYRLVPLHGQTVRWENVLPYSPLQTVVDEASATAEAASSSASDVQTNASAETHLPGEIFLKVSQKEPSNTLVTYPIQYNTRYLSATPYIQSADPAIVQAAAGIVGNEKRAYYAARLLQQWVYKNITQKNLSLGFASAKETLVSHAGDCTEHAVLLTALARSLGIPARVAVGLIYLPDDTQGMGRFVYHMWTEVYVGEGDQGEWTPLDATNPQVLPDATHIKLADSALADSGDLVRVTEAVVGVMGRIKIDVLKAMSPAQSIISVGDTPGVLKTEISKFDLARIDIRTLSRRAIQRYQVNRQDDAMSMDTADGLFTYGLEHLSQGDYEGAQDAFRKALGKVHRSVECYRMGERLASIGVYGLSRQAFEQAAQGDSALAPLAREAVRTLLPSPELPETLNREFLLAVHARANDADSTDAILKLKNVLSQAPDFAPAYRHLAELSDGPTAVQALKKATALAPNDFQNSEALGDQLQEQGHYAEAAKAYAQAAAVIKGRAFARSKPWADILDGKHRLALGGLMLARNKQSVAGWLEIGRGLLLEDRTEEAAQAFNNALILSPGSTDALLARFQTSLRNADWDNLSTLKDRVAALSGGNATAAKLLGQYQMRTRQYGAAIQTLQHAIAMAPTRPEAYQTLANVYQRLAEQQPSTPNVNPQKTKGKNPQSKNQAKAHGRTYVKPPVSLATRYRQQSEHVLAQGLARMTSVETRSMLALSSSSMLLRRGQAAPAQTLAENVLANDPLNGEAYALKGQAQFYRGDLVSARDTLQTALVLNPDNGLVLAQLGHLAQEEGRDSLALSYYQKASQTDPFSADAGLSLRTLMIQMRIAGKKLPDYWYLSADEHDYLVQAFYAARQLKQNNLDYMQRLSALLGSSGKVPFTVAGVQSVQDFTPQMQGICDRELVVFHRLDAMRVPPRFAGLHEQLLRLVRNDLAVYQQAVKSFATLQSDKASAKAYGALAHDGGTVRKALAAELANLNAHLPEAVYQGIRVEARMNDADTVNQHLSNTEKALNASLTRQSQAEAESQASQKQGSDPMKGAVGNLGKQFSGANGASPLGALSPPVGH